MIVFSHFIQDGECYNQPDGEDYTGLVNLTQSGLQCLPWRDTVLVTNNITINVSNLGRAGHNYCRNPAPGTMNAPWCLVEDDDDGATWEYCYVGEPQMRCLQGSVLNLNARANTRLHIPKR